MDISNIKDQQAKMFINQFLRDREINKEFYKCVPDHKFDFRMVDSQLRKSDSPRESLVHQIDTTRDYINGVKTGILHFGVEYDDLIDSKKLTRVKLLSIMEEGEKELINRPFAK